MKTANEWFIELMAEISRLKNRNKIYCYHPMVELSEADAKELERSLRDPEFGYTVEFRKCAQCLNKYDIVIGWTL
jgi:hypothetical protein